MNSFQGLQMPLRSKSEYFMGPRANCKILQSEAPEHLTYHIQLVKQVLTQGLIQEKGGGIDCTSFWGSEVHLLRRKKKTYGNLRNMLP